MSNPFVLAPEEYKRSLDFYKTYARDVAKYISLRTGKPFEEVLKWVVANTKPGNTGKFPFVDPKVKILEREVDGDREQKLVPLTEILKKAVRLGSAIAPNLTVYANPKVKESLTGRYLVGELANRNKNKGLMFDAKRAGNTLMQNIYNNRQNRNKIKCNSVSGAHGTKSSVLCLVSAHSTLTSTCRSASSNTNANVERFLLGNRHYWSYEIAQQNIVSIVNHSDYDAIRAAMQKYKLGYPSVEYTFEHVLRSTRLYWRSPELEEKLRLLVEALSDIERAAYVYTGCMYSLAELHPEFVRRLLGGLSEKPTQHIPAEETAGWIKKLDEDAQILLVIIAHRELDGKKLKDDDVVNGPHYGWIGALAKQLYETVQDYADFIRAFWRTPNMPASMAHFPESIRRCVVASDTDSSIFSTQYWTEWYVGELEFGERSANVSAAVTYLCSQLTVHLLALMSANMGVVTEKIHMLAMKNEYSFPVFFLTSMAKHYFASQAVKEGIVFKKHELEIKGATLRNSKAPTYLMDKSDELIETILTTISGGKKIELRAILQQVADEEHRIKHGIGNGDSLFFSTATIKPAKGYKNENSPYLNYTLWQEVFAPKYGVITEPPYRAIKMSMLTNTPNKVNTWLDSLPDQDLAERFRQWMRKYNKKYLTTIYLPISYAEVHGIPEELLEMMNYRKLIYGLMTSYYLILESLGYYTHEKHLTKMVSDYFPPSWGVDGTPPVIEGWESRDMTPMVVWNSEE
jgi:hypothetical protein